MKSLEELIDIKKKIVNSCNKCKEVGEPSCHTCISKIKKIYLYNQANIPEKFWNTELENVKLKTLLADFKYYDKIKDKGTNFIFQIEAADDVTPVLLKQALDKSYSATLVNFLEVFKDNNLKLDSVFLGIINMNGQQLENYRTNLLESLLYQRKYNNLPTIISTTLDLNFFKDAYQNLNFFIINSKFINLI